jgi:hypothetical protein
VAVTDLADAAAAVTAGYKKVQIDRGATPTTPNFNANQPARYATVLSKWLTDSGFQLEVRGESNASAAAADTAVLDL